MSKNELSETGDASDGPLGRVQGGLSRLLGEKPTSEHALLVLFFAFGAVMFVGADGYSHEARLFPQILSAIVVVLSVLLLLRNYLPGPIRSFVAEPFQIGSDTDLSEEYGDADETESGDDAEESPSENETDGEEDELTGAYVYDVDDWVGPAVVALLSVGYLVLALVIGLIYSTPLFVAAYLLWANRPLGADMRAKLGSILEIVALSALAFVIALGFEWVAPRSISEGIWTGWEIVLPLGGL
ncbi:tripartite tricarboxylate transporter TctB family protein [Natrarchaeobaculum sulfurireducens]|uniref:Uncharacterized protein n=1 Tax=Natrarchaeobaculum sulfurireducens TaxID=2044521 RepID=A0A346PVJ8_9EURY|nr:tripartite tricarboxylate transporter TctB family protein [Natrarchaeobaculum sulfurireducens]AXR83543.1 hypothetical protein AArcMg_3570 [Natrarchaeobaculum sulfurireducens]